MSRSDADPTQAVNGPRGTFPKPPLPPGTKLWPTLGQRRRPFQQRAPREPHPLPQSELAPPRAQKRRTGCLSVQSFKALPGVPGLRVPGMRPGPTQRG